MGPGFESQRDHFHTFVKAEDPSNQRFRGFLLSVNAGSSHLWTSFGSLLLHQNQDVSPENLKRWQRRQFHSIPTPKRLTNAREKFQFTFESFSNERRPNHDSVFNSRQQNSLSGMKV